MFMLTPYNMGENFEVMDYRKKAHKSIFDEGTKSLYARVEDRFSGDTSEINQFTDKAKDRSMKLGTSVEYIPHEGTLLNLFVYWALFDYAVALAYVKTFMGRHSRLAQEDTVWFYAFLNSMSEGVARTVALHRNKYVLHTRKGDVHCSGILLFIIMLRESAVVTAHDPDIIRQQIAKSRYKLAELGYDIKEFHKWILNRMACLASSKQTSTDIVTHMMSAYRTHSDKDLVDYIERQVDDAKDAEKVITPPWLIRKVEGKLNRIQAREDLESLQQAEDIHVLESRVQGNQQSHNNNFARRSNNGGGRGRGNGGRGRGRGNNQRSNNAGRGRGGRGNSRSRNGPNNKKKKYLPPPELRNKPKPTNPFHKETVRGFDYYWCDNHTWCSHTTPECKKPDTGTNNNNNNNSNSNNSNGGGRGDRNGRRVSAYTSLIQRGQDARETVQE